MAWDRQTWYVNPFRCGPELTGRSEIAIGFAILHRGIDE